MRSSKAPTAITASGSDKKNMTIAIIRSRRFCEMPAVDELEAQAERLALELCAQMDRAAPLLRLFQRELQLGHLRLQALRLHQQATPCLRILPGGAHELLGHQVALRLFEMLPGGGHLLVGFAQRRLGDADSLA